MALTLYSNPLSFRLGSSLSWTVRRMTLSLLLSSLSEAERDYIASRDYGEDVAEHRQQLDAVIALGGSVDMALQYWFPYEVIELSKNSLAPGHEREFAAAAGVVLHNMLNGNDTCNDIDWLTSCIEPYKEDLPKELFAMLKGLLSLVENNA